MIFNVQLRAARGLIDWSQQDLAVTAGVGFSTIRRMERGTGPVRGTAENVWKVQGALEDAGVVFIDAEEDGDGPGVRLKGRGEDR